MFPHFNGWLALGNLRGFNRELFEAYLADYRRRLPPQAGSLVLIAETDPHLFLAAFVAVLSAEGSVVLANPQWGEGEWADLRRLIRPRRWFGAVPESCFPWLGPQFELGPERILIPTGGSSGQIKLALHTLESLLAAVDEFRAFWGDDPLPNFCVLPLYHIGGLMQVLRAWLSDGALRLYSYPELKENPPQGDYRDWFLSLVPTQLQFLLRRHPQWLAQFKTILLGGGPAWPSLLTQARELRLNLAPTYGMTETGGTVAAIRPEAFLTGTQGAEILPHLWVNLRQENQDWPSPGEIGVVEISGPSLFQGYYPHLLGAQNRKITDDLGYFDEENKLHILGRRGRCIITGGEKVYPQQVEAVILQTGWVEDAAVLGLPDPHWGEKVVAVYVPYPGTDPLAALKASIKQNLAPYKRPKEWIAMDSLGRSALGKLNYEKLKQTLETRLEGV
ncbi:MAG: AMP-binding protein [Cyanobacteria bacterium RI_101]|nr:AMP-binding protein [Cyanobacteria bacterium RI_101]